MDKRILVFTLAFSFASHLYADCSYNALLSDLKSAGTGYSFSNSVASGTVCGKSVVLSSLSGSFRDITSNFQNTKGSDIVNALKAMYLGQSSIQLAGDGQIMVDGVTVFQGNTITPADLTALLQALGLSGAGSPYFSSQSLASTSASSRTNDIVYNTILSPMPMTAAQKAEKNERREKLGLLNGLNLFFADVRYEGGEFRQSNESVDIAGFTAGASFDIDEAFSVGALVPYDHLDIGRVEANRTGLIIYGKHRANFGAFELTSTINGNYMYTDSQTTLAAGGSTLSDRLDTFGGGIGTRLQYDNDGSFIPSATFSFQYNEDAQSVEDIGQALIKIGPALGYRINDNALIQVSGVWNKDIASAIVKQGNIAFGKRDGEFFNLGVEGTWSFSKTWQLRGGYRRILDLDQYESDSVYLGSSMSF